MARFSATELAPLKKVRPLREAKDLYVLKALKTSDWHQTVTAESLDVSVRFVNRTINRLRKTGIHVPNYSGRPRRRA